MWQGQQMGQWHQMEQHWHMQQFWQNEEPWHMEWTEPRNNVKYNRSAHSVDAVSAATATG